MAVEFRKAARMLWQLPRTCRVFKQLQPATEWGYSEIFLNKAVFLLETLVWQKGFDPKKKAQSMASKPALFTPEFMKNQADEGIKKDVVSYDVDEIKEILARPRN